MFRVPGLWTPGKIRSDTRRLQSFATVPTDANELMSSAHPRMPVILDSRDYDWWPDRGKTERVPIDLLRPFEAEAMEMFEANPLVNSVRNNGPEMLRAAVKAAEDGELPL